MGQELRELIQVPNPEIYLLLICPSPFSLRPEGEDCLTGAGAGVGRMGRLGDPGPNSDVICSLQIHLVRVDSLSGPAVK